MLATELRDKEKNEQMVEEFNVYQFDEGMENGEVAAPARSTQ